MTPEELAAYALAKPGAWSDSPWGEDHGVAKVADKIFAFLGEDMVGVRCGLSRAEADEWLREFPDEAIMEAVDDSYAMVVAKLPRSRRP